MIQMIELKEDELKDFKRHSSKGNQMKWESHGFWYKADYSGYEGMAECVISKLLGRSNLSGNEIVIYDSEEITYKRNVYHGAKSKNFLEKDWQLITLQRLYQDKYHRNLMEDVWHIHELEGRLEYLVARTVELTGLVEFGTYISKLLTIDAFFLNEDRHMHNIAVLMNSQGEFKYCPFFDHGAGLLADTSVDYPLGYDPLEMLKEVKAKTICSDFDDALDIAEKRYGNHLKFSFTKKDVNNIVDSVSGYSDEIKDRVKKIIFYQMDKYQYLFTKTH